MLTHVAIIYRGITYSLPKPNRHCNVIFLINKLTGQSVHENEQGFLDNTGRFYNRKDAWVYAIANSQFKSEVVKANQLFSEDIW